MNYWAVFHICFGLNIGIVDWGPVSNGWLSSRNSPEIGQYWLLANYSNYFVATFHANVLAMKPDGNNPSYHILSYTSSLKRNINGLFTGQWYEFVHNLIVFVMVMIFTRTLRQLSLFTTETDQVFEDKNFHWRNYNVCFSQSDGTKSLSWQYINGEELEFCWRPECCRQVNARFFFVPSWLTL